jgi:ATP-binding cassette subfamily B multidrug efflux pump
VSADSFHEDDAVGKAVDVRLLRRLWTYVRPHRGWLWFSTAALAAVSWLDLLPAALLKRTVDGPLAARVAGEIGDAGLAASLGEMALLFAAALVASFVLRGLQTIAVNIAGQRTLHDLRTAVFRHCQRMPLSWYDRNPVGRLVTRAVYDVESLNEVLTSGVDALFHDFLKILFIAGWLLLVNWQLALATFVVLPPLFWAAHRFRTANRAAFREVRARVAGLNAYLQEQVQGIRVVQLFSQEERSRRGFTAANGRLRDAHLGTVWNYAWFFPAVEMLAAAAVAVLWWFGGARILEGQLTLGEFVQFYILLDLFFEPVREISEKYNLLQQAVASAERLFGVLDAKPDMTPPASPVALPEPARGEVEFDGVTFGYTADRPALKGVSFRVRPGERVAIVGATGAGKTTVTALLSRLYDPQSGAIRVDGVDLREADPAGLRRRVAVVLQDVFLFAGDVLSNITLGDPAVPEERAIAAARAVRADGFIRALPGGYRAEIRERGAGLSVGQKQLLSFARALARDPALLVLDEATSSVDSETEALVQAAVEEMMKGRTAIVVAHRLSTVRSCDRILVFHHGEIVEEGSHAALLARGGVYARLYALQFAAQEGRSPARRAPEPTPAN